MTTQTEMIEMAREVERLRKRYRGKRGHDPRKIYSRTRLGLPDKLQDDEVLEQLRKGLSDKQIAYALGVKTYEINRVMRRLRKQYGVTNRVQLLIKAGKV